MTLFGLLKLAHVLSAIWLMSGLLARPMVLAVARRGPDMRLLKALADVSGHFEDRMIAPGFVAVLVTGIATAVVGGIPLFGPFVDGPNWIFLALILMAIAIAFQPRTLARDRRWGQALEEAAHAGVITERLRPFLERGTMLRRYAPDLVVTLTIVALMVLKPF